MEDILSILKHKSLSKNLEESATAVEELVKIVIQTMNVILDSFEMVEEKFVIAEKMSLAFDSYVNRLEGYLNNKSNGIDFWSASLLAHYRIDNTKAVNLLLDNVKYGEINKAGIATTILCRIKNSLVKEAIHKRISDMMMDEKDRAFFEEKLSDLK